MHEMNEILMPILLQFFAIKADDSTHVTTGLRILNLRYRTLAFFGISLFFIL